MLHGLLQPDLEPEIADLERSAPRVPVRVRAIDDELLLPCPQSCAPLKHRLRQSNATARRTVLADPDASALLRRVGAACISPVSRLYLAYVLSISRPYLAHISPILPVYLPGGRGPRLRQHLGGPQPAGPGAGGGDVLRGAR